MRDGDNPHPARLSDLSARLPRNSVNPPRGSGFLMWTTRRLNAFRRACSVLQTSTGSFDDLEAEARAVSDFIASVVPLEITSLPRGYSIVLSHGERVLAHGNVRFVVYSDPVPSAFAMRQLGADLKTGLFLEIEGLIRGSKK